MRVASSKSHIQCYRTPMSRISLLTQSPLFENIPTSALKDAAAVMIEQKFEAGQTIVEQNLDGDTLHILTKGSVRVIRTSQTGRERMMGDLYAPAVIGETAVLHAGHRSATVIALETVHALLLHRQHFEQLLQRQPQILWNLATMLSKRVTFLNDELIALGHTTEAAIIYVLLGIYEQRLHAKCPQPAMLPLNTTDLMNRVSASRETVTRVTRRLEAHQLLRVKSRQIELLNPEGLIALMYNLD